MYLSHCLHELLQFYRPQSRLGQSERWFCVYFFCFFFVFLSAFPQRLLPKQKHSFKTRMNCCIFSEGEGYVCVVQGVPPPPKPPPHPFLPAGFWVTLCPSPPALWPVFSWDSSDWGCAVRPWRINQKALLARVFSLMSCLCVCPTALEDYLCWLGCWICRSGCVCSDALGCFSSTVHLLCWLFLKPIWRM